MPQQINLSTPILLAQRRYFSAQTMVQTLAIFLLVGGALAAYWVTSLNTASEALKATLATRDTELQSLQAATRQGTQASAPAGATLTRDLQTRQAELLAREQLMQALQRGLFQPGLGHSARLQMLAQTIPESVWLTAVTADEQQLDLSGATLNPAALNDWISRLAQSPLLDGQRLSTVRLDSPADTAQPTELRPQWTFNLVSALVAPGLAAGVTP